MATKFQSAEVFRSEFSRSNDWLYFDHASTGYYPARTVAAIQKYAEEAANPINYDTDRNEDLRQAARDKVARLSGVPSDAVAFTSSLSEAMNLFANGLDWSEGDNIIVPAGEFPSVTYTFVNIRKRFGIELRRIPRDHDGRTDLDAIRSAIDSNTRAIAISHVEWADGYRNNIAALGDVCRQSGIELFVDVTQSMGAQLIDVDDWGASAVAAHAYKWLLAGHGLGVVAFGSGAVERIYPAYAGFHSFETELDDASYSYDDTSRDYEFKTGALRYQTGGFDKLSMTALDASLSLVLEAGPERSSEHGNILANQIAEGVIRKGYQVISDRGQEHSSQFIAITSGSVAGDEQVLQDLENSHVKVALRPKGIRVAPYFYHDAADVERFIESLPVAP